VHMIRRTSCDQAINPSRQNVRCHAPALGNCLDGHAPGAKLGDCLELFETWLPVLRGHRIARASSSRGFRAFAASAISGDSLHLRGGSYITNRTKFVAALAQAGFRLF
jgi:hypothetical protein